MEQRDTTPDVIDCTGISIGNSDIEGSSTQGQVRPEDVQAGTTPLPIYPQPSDLPTVKRVAQDIHGRMRADGLLPDRRRALDNDCHRADRALAGAVWIIVAALFVYTAPFAIEHVRTSPAFGAAQAVSP